MKMRLVCGLFAFDRSPVDHRLKVNMVKVWLGFSGIRNSPTRTAICRYWVSAGCRFRLGFGKVIDRKRFLSLVLRTLAFCTEPKHGLFSDSAVLVICLWSGKSCNCNLLAESRAFPMHFQLILSIRQNVVKANCSPKRPYGSQGRGHWS